MKRSFALAAALAALMLASPASSLTRTRTQLKLFSGPGAPASPNASQCGDVSYGRGALMQNVKVVLLFWGSSAATYKDQLSAYYAAVTQSAYFDWMREYDSGSYKIRRGTFAGAFVDPSPPSKTTLDDQQDIQPHLSALISAGTVPAPDDDTIYMIHFPSGTRITQYGASSCNQFCAYHSSFGSGNQSIRYGVIPDQLSGGCEQGCAQVNDAVAAYTEVASHELIEAVTDPDGDGWTGAGGNCSEVGDICVGEQGSAASYVVQLEWSNKQGKCVDHDASVKVADYALAVDQTVQGYLGGTATATVTGTPASGSSAVGVALTVTGLPDGVTAALSPASIQSNATSTLTFTVGAGATPGTYTFTVTGASTGDNVIHTVTGSLDLAATAPPDMAMAGNGGGGNGGNDGGISGGNGSDGGTGNNGGNGGGGNGGNGSGHNGGNGNGNNGGNGSGGSGGDGGRASGGCSSVGGGALEGLGWSLALLVALALVMRRRERA